MSASSAVLAAAAAVASPAAEQEGAPATTISIPQPPQLDRARVEGKFLWAGGQKLFVKGVTYGPFRPGSDGEYGSPAAVQLDFCRIAATGFNAVRTYTVPPRWVLDTAARHGLRVMVGLPWEQHIAFLDDASRMRQIEHDVRAKVRQCAGHPAVLCYAVGNEIPASIVRWSGRQPVERFIERLYQAVKEEDPEGLVTYVNYPTTEYLELPFLDFVAFNVYLESEEQLRAYLARLQVLSGERPLLLAEVGLDSRRNGTEAQAETLDWQIRCAFSAGSVGSFVFAWTDEWHRGGQEIEDWDFGLTGRDREPKPALFAAEAALHGAAMQPQPWWPRSSVIVCSYNGERTIEDSCRGLRELNYSDFEVIVVDDGSTARQAANSQS